MNTSSVLILFALIKIVIIHAQNVIKSAAITPQLANTNDGVYILTHLQEVTKDIGYGQWRILTSYQNTWQFIIILDDKWAFIPNEKSSVSFTIRSPTCIHCPGFTQANDDIILGFAINNYEYISMSLPIGDNNPINTNKIFPNCYPTTNLKSDFAVGDISSLPDFNRRCDVANHDCRNWANMQPDIPHEYNSFPITVTFTNDPNTNTLQIQYHSQSSSVQTCFFASFPTNQVFKIYVGGNKNGQRFDINSFDFEKRIYTPAPTINPTQSTPLPPTLLTTNKPIDISYQIPHYNYINNQYQNIPEQPPSEYNYNIPPQYQNVPEHYQTPAQYQYYTPYEYNKPYDYVYTQSPTPNITPSQSTSTSTSGPTSLIPTTAIPTTTIPTTTIPTTAIPSNTPTSMPTTQIPTTTPTTSLPTTLTPTPEPTPKPTLHPTPKPTLHPTPKPTLQPTKSPIVRDITSENIIPSTTSTLSSMMTTSKYYDKETSTTNIFTTTDDISKEIPINDESDDTTDTTINRISSGAADLFDKYPALKIGGIIGCMAILCCSVTLIVILLIMVNRMAQPEEEADEGYPGNHNHDVKLGITSYELGTNSENKEIIYLRV